MTIENVIELAENQMRKHGLIDWKFKFNNRKSSLGICHATRKMISLSKPIMVLNLDKKDLILQVILHEIAHALDYTRNGYSSHGYNWKVICREIGCEPRRTENPDAFNRPKSKYTYVCPNCGKTVGFERRLKTKSACVTCCNEYNNGRYSEKFALQLKY